MSSLAPWNLDQNLLSLNLDQLQAVKIVARFPLACVKIFKVYSFPLLFLVLINSFAKLNTVEPKKSPGGENKPYSDGFVSPVASSRICLPSP